MARFANGAIPLHLLVWFGAQFYLTPGTAARWKWMVNAARDKYGVILRPTAGWNGYRPLDEQKKAKAELGILAAAPGYSSHGGTYQGRECMAIDVNNWRELAPGNESLAWSRFVALCRLAGFTVDFVTPREQWHIGDFNDIWTIPASLQEEDMTPEQDTRLKEIENFIIGNGKATGAQDGGIAWKVGLMHDRIRDIENFIIGNAQATRTQDGGIANKVNIIHDRVLGALPGPQNGRAKFPRVLDTGDGNYLVELLKAATVDPETVKTIIETAFTQVALPAPTIDYAAVAKAVNDDAAARMAA